MRVDVIARGERAHSARSWKGVNAIHRAGEILDRLNAYEARRPVIDGLEYHEGLNAVFISGGVAGNVLPDVCTVQVNHRFAPDRSEAEAAAYVKEFFSGFEVVVTDSAPGALPGLDRPAAKEFVEAVGGAVNPKFGWTDVARFSRPRRARRELRARRPDAGPQAGGVRARRAGLPVRVGPAHLAGRLNDRRVDTFRHQVPKRVQRFRACVGCHPW